MKNQGKKFEEDFRKSLSDDIFYYRFRDSGGNWNRTEKSRFTINNIADNMIFFNGCLFLNELKTHKGKSIPISCIMGNKTKEKQIKDLEKANKYHNIFSNIIIFLSDIERCFALDIENFLFFMQENDRQSIPLEYLEIMGIEIDVTKIRTNYRFNIKKWLNEYYGGE